MGSQYSASDFDYEYPTEAVAQHPLPDRSASRLLVLDKETGAVQHKQFRDFPALLTAGDVLVVNSSRVIPARLHGLRDNGRPAEILLVHPEPDGSWLGMVHPGGKLKVGRRVRFGDAAAAEVSEVVGGGGGGGLRRLRFTGRLNVRALLERYGTVPLPPYIKRAPVAQDRERYQTVHAKVDGSVAAPTAGLHFTPEILDDITNRGVHITEIVLHVGPGTFKPVEVEELGEHRMHAEWYTITEQSSNAVNRTKSEGGRVWAVGTTSARSLETAAATDATVEPGEGWTDLFIYPPYQFTVVDALLTNFHLPRSTLLMMVAAFAGHERAMAAYREAFDQGYRLFSYGDAMAIL